MNPDMDSRASSLLASYATGSALPVSKLLLVKQAILEQMELGLSHKDLGLMMLPSFVDAFPSSLEPSPTTDPYFAIDLGGTSLKVVRIELQDGMLQNIQKREWVIPEECYETENGRLLGWIVECFVGEFADDARNNHCKPVIGFCYSFACRQDNLDHGEQILWTKRFKGTGLLGVDVVQALRDEFAQRGVQAVIPALMNDSVASLVGAQFADARVRASVILGTGTNCSYVENVRNIKTLPTPYRKHGDRMIINTEWGDCTLPSRLGITLEEDDVVDRESANPGHGLFEKLISGLYIGDVARRIIARIARDTGMFSRAEKGHRGLNLKDIEDFDGAALSRVYHDISEDLTDIGVLFHESFGVEETTLEERRVVREVSSMIVTRSARLCAAAIVAIASRESASQSGTRGGGREPVVVSVDGSTFTKFKGYRELVKAAIDELREEEAGLPPIEITLADGSSVCGAAICAAVFTRFT